MVNLAQIRSCIESLQEYLQQHKHCYLCRQASKDLVCEVCAKDTSLTLLPVPGFDLLMQPKLAEHLVTPYYHHFYALGEYAGILKILINRLKFGNNPLAAEVLAQFFMNVVYPRISQLDDLPELLVPIPLSMWRYVGREYNQARLLAQSISKLSNIPIAECLIRSRYTRAQSQLDREARLANIDNAFAINQQIQSNHIALIDDVVTTGATVNSACRTIVKHHPDMRISIWSMAVTPSKKQATVKETYR